DGNDSLTLDFSLGEFKHAVNYDGGSEAGAGGDSLSLSDTNPLHAQFNSVAHSFTDEHQGSVALVRGSSSLEVTYQGLEPIADNLSATARVFTFNGGS